MWIVRVALKRPYTFVVLAILILILGTLAIFRTTTDIFPIIDMPVVSIVWNYTVLSPTEMSNRIITLQERNLTTIVNDIEHIESQSLNGIAVIKVFFHPGVNISMAIAQIAGQSQTQLKQLPAGTTPPLIITYSASSVPILQMALSGPTLSEQQLNDLGLNFIRPQLTSVPGTAIPYPYGGKQRQVQVDLNTAALQAKGLSPLDVVNAISAQNLILPAGTAKIGTFEYNVNMILMFLGSLLSTLIIAISIPLSILSSIIALSALGETINLMTLGGLALAVGILVDDATVTIENIHRYLAEGKDIEEAILDGAQQIAIPALVSTLSICIVFVPMFLLTGVARYLFVPLAEAVVFAMLASYLLSRTLVPTMAKYFLKTHEEE